MINLTQILGDYHNFLDTILKRVQEEGFDISDFSQIDHMCYRTTSLGNYEEMKIKLSSHARLLGETMVNSRPISTFRLHEPIIYDKWRIDAIELPAPKTGSEYNEGLEHIEFVLFDDIPAFLDKYNGKPFELKAVDRGINPEIGLKLGGMSVKFHLMSLPAVVYLERKLGIKEVKDKE